MVNFLIGLCVVMLVALGGYYYWFMQQPDVQAEQERGAAAQVQIDANTKVIPPGAVIWLLHPASGYV